MRCNKIVVGTCVALVLTLGLALVPPYKTEERDTVVIRFPENTSLRSTQLRRSRTQTDDAMEESRPHTA
jgi:hypothetical protein